MKNLGSPVVSVLDYYVRSHWFKSPPEGQIFVSRFLLHLRQLAHSLMMITPTGGNLEGAAGTVFKHFRCRDGPWLPPPIFRISEILAMIINVHSVCTVLFAGLRGV